MASAARAVLACVMVSCAQPRPVAEPTDTAVVVAAERPSAVPPGAAEEPAPAPSQRVLPSGVQVEDLRAGTGALVETGMRVRVHYVGTLAGGQKIDSSRDRGTPFEFGVGSGSVIRGFEQGVEGMRVGGVRRVTIPPAEGYGSGGRPPTIPPNTDLVFEIELIEIR